MEILGHFIIVRVRKGSWIVELEKVHITLEKNNNFSIELFLVQEKFKF